MPGIPAGLLKGTEMMKEFEKKLIKSLGGQTRVNPDGEKEPKEVWIEIDAAGHVYIMKSWENFNPCAASFVCPKDWEMWDEAIDLIKRSVRLYREG